MQASVSDLDQASVRESGSRGVASLRAASVLAALAMLILVGGFFARLPWATTLWPWPAAPLSYVFIASILAAIAIPMLWIGITGEWAAARAGSLDLAVMYSGMCIYVSTLAGDRGEPVLWPYGIVFGTAFLGCVAAFVRFRRVGWRDARPMPGVVRASFAALAVILVAAGAALISQADIFPWHLTAESSVMFGLIYLGAAIYFICGLLEPRWSNAAGQLAGFLAYDIVLLPPFLDHFTVATGSKLVSLIVYTLILAYSGVIAIYYLFFHRATRISIAGH